MLVSVPAGALMIFPPDVFGALTTAQLVPLLFGSRDAVNRSASTTSTGRGYLSGAIVRRVSHDGPTSAPASGRLVIAPVPATSSAPTSSGATRVCPSKSCPGAIHEPLAAWLIAG